MAEVLGLFGYEVRIIYDPLDALSARLPDVVILELRLPGLDGWDLVRQLRARADVKQPFFIAVTTYGREEECRKSQEAGIDLHLVKPVDSAVIVGALKRFTHVLAREAAS
jgi:DNA-binding response OmpR family regulator